MYRTGWTETDKRGARIPGLANSLLVSDERMVKVIRKNKIFFLSLIEKLINFSIDKNDPNEE